MFSHFNSYWEQLDTPLHTFKDEKGYKEYYKEISYLIEDKVNILDIGCGSGEFSALMLEQGKMITGVDFSEKMLSKARQVCNEYILAGRAKFINGDAKTVSSKLNGEKFDIIFSNGLLQYLSPSETKAFLLEMRSFLNDGGFIVMMNIPDINYYDLFHAQFYENFLYPKSGISLAIKLLFSVLKYRAMKVLIPNQWKQRQLGYWYSTTFFYSLSNMMNMTIACKSSIFREYGYRFHIIIK